MTLKLYLYVAALLVLILSNIATGIWQQHEGTLAGAAALAKMKDAQAQAVTDATTAAQAAQAKADADQLAQMRDTLQAAQRASVNRDDQLKAQAARVQSLEAALRVIPKTDSATAMWMGPLPPNLRKALNGGQP